MLAYEHESKCLSWAKCCWLRGSRELEARPWKSWHSVGGRLGDSNRRPNLPEVFLPPRLYRLLGLSPRRRRSRSHKSGLIPANDPSTFFSISQPTRRHRRQEHGQENSLPWLAAASDVYCVKRHNNMRPTTLRHIGSRRLPRFQSFSPRFQGQAGVICRCSSS